MYETVLRRSEEQSTAGISGALQQWAGQHGIKLDYIQRGNSQQNVYVERYSRTVRYDWFAQLLFESIEQGRESATR